MSIYIFPNLDEELLELVTEAGVELDYWDDTHTSVMDSQYEALLAALNATGSLSASAEYEDVMLATLQFIPRLKDDDGNFTPEVAAARARYIELCAQRLEADVAAARLTLLEQSDLVPPLMKALVEVRRREVFGAAGLKPEQLAQLCRREYERLLEVPHVLAVRIAGNSVLVYTDTLYVENPETGKRHEVGKFLLKVNLDGSETAVRYFNGTQRVDGFQPEMNAPNVYADGMPAADELQATLCELLVHFEISALVDLAIQFVEEAQSATFNRYIANWPLAS